MKSNVDDYFTRGCGRCEKFDTPACKVRGWSEELALLRTLLLGCNLEEERKWGHPCYTSRGENSTGKNIVILHCFKEYVGLTFVSGALFEDPQGLLIQQTKNVQEGRQLRFTSVGQIKNLEPAIREFVLQGIAVAEAGLKVKKKETKDFEVPEELTSAFQKDREFKRAFEALTPGRQRGYLLHFAGAKQSKTRAARIEKNKPKIFAGRGLQDR